MKGLFKGFRYFTHMFEEQKEPEIQIGAPTDVKHVAHIGWDGPSSSAETPSWMKEFKSSGEYDAAPAPPPTSSRSAVGNKSTRDVPRSSNYSQSPSRETSSTKSKHSKRGHLKEGSKSVLEADQSPPRIPTEGTVKKSRRKKSKESINVGPSKSTRSKPKDPFSDSGSPGLPVVLGSNKGNMR